VLGAVRGSGPVHGYDLRRELLSWGADEWANVAPGSVYSALKTLVREGLLEVVATGRHGARPERTVYRLTGAGEREFERLLGETLRRSALAHHPLLAALAFVPHIAPGDLAEVMRERATELRRQVVVCRAMVTAIIDGSGDPGQGHIPHHVAESYRLIGMLMEAEATWAGDFARRLGGERDVELVLRPFLLEPDASEEPQPLLDVMGGMFGREQDEAMLGDDEGRCGRRA
jgi:DNA-binding PadR family transcriptional regulator